MKVAVNIHCLHPPLTGIGHYARHLIQGLLDDTTIESVVGVSHAGWHEREEVAAIVAHARGYQPRPVDPVQPVKPSIARRLLRRVPGVGRLRARINYRLKQPETQRYQDYVYWEPNYLLLPLSNPALVSVHDLSHVRYPEFHPSERLAELARLPASIQQARQIATISEFTRSELVDVFGVDPARVSLVPPAVSSRFIPRTAAECESVLKQYQLPENYILYAGTLEPRKNLPRLLRAYASLPAELQQRHKLVLMGGDGWHPEEFEAALAAVDSQHIIRLGYVDFDALPQIFSRAAVFAYPSLYEGFGMPVLEAMASGVPVLTANRASMPEVAAGAARLVEPESVDDIASGLQAMLEDPALLASMREQGLAVAAGHSWQRSYSLLRDALEAVKV